jgi:hypothetical protein
LAFSKSVLKESAEPVAAFTPWNVPATRRRYSEELNRATGLETQLGIAY